MSWRRHKKPIGLPLADLLYLRRKQMGLTQGKLALRLQREAESKGSWSGATAQLIHRYEVGVIPRADSLEWLATSLGLSLRTIREQARQQNALLESVSPSPSPQINDRTASAGVLDSKDGDGEVRRRELGGLGLGALSVIPGLDLERFKAILGGSQMDEQSLDQLKAVADELMQKSWNAEPKSLLPLVTDHFSSFGTVLLRVPSKFSSRALSMAGEMAFLAGYLSQKRGLDKDSELYWQTAEWMAQAAGDTSLQTILFINQSWRAYSQGRLDQAVKISDQAQSLLRMSPNPGLAAVICSSRSYKLTAVGQNQAAARDLEMADHYLAQLPENDAPIYTLETVREEVEEARGWHFLHVEKYSEAASTFEQMLDRINPTWKSWHALTKANLASVYAQQGNIEQAAHTFSSALSTAREAGAVRYEQHALKLRQQWLGNNDSAAVRRLDEAFASR